jgi:RimJ/RimL family protein N-acetyltransferase
VTGPGDVLETPRLLLRRFRPDDLEALVELGGDPAVMHWITGGVPTPRAEVEDDVLPALVASSGFWAAELRTDGAFAGWFHLRPASGAPTDEPELGYRLRSEVWGRGLATEGARALVDLAFSTLGARRVVAETLAVHAASRRVMEKAGLTLVRTFTADWPYRIDGDEHGDVECAPRHARPPISRLPRCARREG